MMEDKIIKDDLDFINTMHRIAADHHLLWLQLFLFLEQNPSLRKFEEGKEYKELSKLRGKYIHLLHFYVLDLLKVAGVTDEDLAKLSRDTRINETQKKLLETIEKIKNVVKGE